MNVFHAYRCHLANVRWYGPTQYKRDPGLPFSICIDRLHWRWRHFSRPRSLLFSQHHCFRFSCVVLPKSSLQARSSLFSQRQPNGLMNFSEDMTNPLTSLLIGLDW